MKVRVQLFAKARDLAGAEFVELELPEGARVGALRSELGRACPALAPLLPTLWIAVNLDYAGDDAIIPAPAEIACFPPVSGG
jgi:molybdopterin converting factor small subunit